MGKCVLESDEESIMGSWPTSERKSVYGKLEISQKIFCSSVVTSRKLWFEDEKCVFVQTKYLMYWVSVIF